MCDFFSCNSKRAKNLGLSLLPVIGWMRIYQLRKWLLGDVVAGVSVGLVSVMQGIFLKNRPHPYSSSSKKHHSYVSPFVSL